METAEKNSDKQFNIKEEIAKLNAKMKGQREAVKKGSILLEMAERGCDKSDPEQIEILFDTRKGIAKMQMNLELVDALSGIMSEVIPGELANEKG